MPTTPSSETLGHRVHLLRRKRKWSQADLAARVGATRPQISKYESGASEPRPEMIVRLAHALDTTADFLIAGHDPRTLRDTRLKSLLAKLDPLPEELRSVVAELLDSLLQVHQLIEVRHRTERRSRKPAG